MTAVEIIEQPVFKTVEFSLKGCEVVSNLSSNEVMEIIEQNNGYHDVPVKLSGEMVAEMKNVEKEINDKLYSQGWRNHAVAIVSGNLVFASKNVSTVNPQTIKVTTLYIGDQLYPIFDLSVQ